MWAVESGILSAQLIVPYIGGEIRSGSDRLEGNEIEDRDWGRHGGCARGEDGPIESEDIRHRLPSQVFDDDIVRSFDELDIVRHGKDGGDCDALGTDRAAVGGLHIGDERERPGIGRGQSAAAPENDIRDSAPEDGGGSRGSGQIQAFPVIGYRKIHHPV